MPYNPKKKQYEDQKTGKVFPTDNPDFVPTENPAKTVEFGNNPRGPVKVDGVDLSREEYNASEGKSGPVTDKVKKVVQDRQARRLALEEAKIRMEMGLPSAGSDPNIQAMDNKIGSLSDNSAAGAQETPANPDEKKPYFSDKGKALRDITGISAISFEGQDPVTEFGLDKIAKIYDFANSIFQGGKSLEQKEAEATLSDLNTDLNNDIALVKEGIKPAHEVRAKVKRAREAIARLENSVKKENAFNLRYRILHGVDVQAEVMKQNEFLLDLERQLAIAEETAINSPIQQKALQDSQITALAKKRLGIQ